MALLKTVFRIIGFVILALIIFAVFQNVIGPQFVRSSVCKQEEGCLYAVSNGNRAIKTVVFSQDGSLLATLGRDNGRIYNAADGKQLSKLYSSANPTPNQLVLSADGTLAAITNTKNEVHLWTTNGEELFSFIPDDALFDLTFVPSYTMLVTGGLDALHFWSTQNGDMVTELPHDDWVTSVAASATGLIAAGQRNGHITLWPIETLEKNFSFQAHEAAEQRSIRSMVFSASGRILASAGEDKRVHLWDTQDGSLLASFDHHLAPVTGLAFSEDEQLLATAAEDSLAFVIDLSENKIMRIWEHRSPLNDVALSPDGQRLAVAMSHEASLVDLKPRQPDRSGFDPGNNHNYQVQGIDIKPGVAIVWAVSRSSD